MNLKTKSSLAAAILLIALFGSGLLVQDYLIQTSLKRSIAEQQSAMVAGIADEVDQRVRINLDALSRVASSMDHALLEDANALNAYLAVQQGSLALFDALIVVSPALQVLGDMPALPGRAGTDVSSLPHLRKVIDTGKPVISAPFKGRVTGSPMVAMSVPISDPDGTLSGILTGSLDLLAPRFLGSLSQRSYGQHGHFIITTQDRLTLVGGVNRTPLEIYLPAGTSPVFDQALAGWEGTGIGVMNNGETKLMSFRTLGTTGWILGAIMPADEAFAAVADSRRTAILLLFASSILVGLLVWLAMRMALGRLIALRDDIVRARTHPADSNRADYGYDEIGDVAASFFNVFDDLARSQKESHERADELQSILDACPIGIAITQDGRITRLNPAFELIFGFSEDTLSGETLERVHDDAADYRETQQRVRSGIRTGKTLTMERQFTRQCGERFWARAYVRQLDPEDVAKGIVMLVEDISERRANEERIRFLAEHDSLTGLPNRLLFNDRLTMAMAGARRRGGRLALMFLDVDRFKNINDSLGHHVGDQVLVQIARRIKSVLRETDTVGRPGGDEFALLLPEIASEDDAAHVAAKVLACLAEPCVVSDRQLAVTASIGIALYPDDGGDAETLSANADAAMYHSKDEGRNNYAFFRTEMNERVLERMQLENALRNALREEQFELHYQPQVDSANQSIVGFEALVRWHHPQQGMISPARFIPVAEETGLIVQLGDWVLNEACRQNLAWQAAGLPPIPVAVNISPLQFRQSEFAATVARVLAHTGLPPECLELELTEGVMMDAAERNIETLRRLRALGVKLSIDDFGTGYSSLAYLKRLPIDTLKIDQAFVRDVVDDTDDAAIITTIIGLANNMRLRVVAEGVENESQMRFLIAGGCGFQQGYLFSRPLPGAEFESFWRRRLSNAVNAD